MHKLLTALITITTLGCTAHTEPVIDTQGIDMVRYENDLSNCKAYGEQIQVSKGLLKGAAAGTAVGAAVGAIGGHVAEGAGYGAVFGAADSARVNDREKQRVVKNCMRGRGYRVLN